MMEVSGIFPPVPPAGGARRLACAMNPACDNDNDHSAPHESIYVFAMGHRQRRFGAPPDLFATGNIFTGARAWVYVFRRVRRFRRRRFRRRRPRSYIVSAASHDEQAVRETHLAPVYIRALDAFAFVREELRRTGDAREDNEARNVVLATVHGRTSS